MSSPESFQVRVPIDNLPQDVVSFFQMKRSRFILPSPKNALEIRTNSMVESVRFNLPTLRLDLGAAVSTICLKSTEDLIFLLNSVPSGDITVDIEGVLEINCSFSLHLGEDIFVNAVPILLSKIRIELCSEDYLELVKPNAVPLSSTTLDLLKIHSRRMEDSRKVWSLIGNDVVSQFSLVIPDQIAFLCRKNPNLKFEAECLEAAICMMNYLSLIDDPPVPLYDIKELSPTVWGCLSDEDSDVSDDNGDGDVMPPTPNALTPVNERSDLSGAHPTTRNLPTGADSDDDNEEVLANWQELEVTEEMRKADLERMFWANLDNEDETNTDENVVGSKRKHG